MNNNKLVYIQTLGCPKNEADSRQMVESLIKEDFSLTKDPLKADYIIINSCTFIQAANEETIDSIFESAAIKKNKNAKLVLAGCFAERYKSTITKELPEVDFHFGTGHYKETGRLIKEKFSLASSELSTSASSDLSTSASTPVSKAKSKNGKHASEQVLNLTKNSNHKIDISSANKTLLSNDNSHEYLKIAEGCNRKCSFCIIPKIRGNFNARTNSNILKEAKQLWDSGITELGIVSQDSGNFSNLNILLEELNELARNYISEKWLRLYYLYPDKKSENIISHFSKWKNLAPFLDMPLQHVSSSILKKMKRAGSYQYYKDLFALFREQKPDGEIRTSFIIGYPEENSKDIDLILQFLEDVRPEKLALFLFSPQEGTKAENYKIHPNKKMAKENLNRISSFHSELAKQIALQRIDKIFPVLIDGENRKEYYGHRFQDAPKIEEITTIDKKSIAIKNNLYNKKLKKEIVIKKGDIILIKILDYFEYNLLGELT